MIRNQHSPRRCARSPHPARRRHPRRAAAAVELSVLLPVLMAIVLGTVDFGRFANYENILSNAARSGAEYGATHRRSAGNASQWQARLETRVLEEAAHLPEFDRQKLSILVENFPNPDGSRRVEVEASYPFRTVVNWPGLPNSVELRHRTAFLEYR